MNRRHGKLKKGVVTIAIVTFNSEKYLPGLLESIESSSYKKIELIFIDNGSSDVTASFLQNYSKIPNRKFFLKKNTGHSAAVNLAMQQCRTEYLILADHDTLFDRNMVTHLVCCADENRESLFAAFVPCIVDPVRQETAYGGNMHFIGKMTLNKDPDLTEVAMAGTTAPLLDLSKIPDNLYFDEGMFIYFNDVDFFFRLRALGLRLRLVPEAVVTHLGGTERFSHRRGSAYSTLRAFYITRNHRLLVLKNYQLQTLIKLLPCFLLYDGAMMAFTLQKRCFMGGYAAGVFSMFRLLPALRRARRKFQADRKTGDSELLGWQPLDFNPGVVEKNIAKKAVSAMDAFFKKYYNIL